ncbi:MAG: Clp protease ClpP [Alistipes sp.]|nr:Clp protease ClpP [Alistipes sp.]
MDQTHSTKSPLRPRASRRYERLIGTLINHDMLDYKGLERRVMHRRVMQLTGRYRGRCHAMGLTAKEFNCSFEKVRRAVYEIENEKSNLTTMNSTIKINNETEVATIDIEGTIGLSESWQFDNPESRVTTYERFKECVARIADLRNARIRVNIRSTGGDVNDAMLIYEALRATGAHVTTCCYGYTASAATIVAQAASEGCRLIAPTSLYLVHNSLCSVEGNAEELEAEVELLRQTDARIAEIYACHSGRGIEEIAALMAENGGRGRWLSPTEVVALGLADAVDGGTALSPQPEKEVPAVKRGVQALLSAIGIGGDDAPDVADDVNYIPHDVTHSAVAFDEGQTKVARTKLKEVEDPDLREAPRDDRKRAYDSDAKAMRFR